jgi:hypothetical protein
MIIEKKFHETYHNFDREIVLEIIDIFLNEYDDRIEKLTTFLKTENIEQIYKSAHAFKGVISNFETDCEAYHEISELETIARQYLQKKTENPDFSDGVLLNKLTKLLAGFKNHSKEMYIQLKKMRPVYAD